MAKLIFPAHNDELSPELLKETNLNWSVKYEDNRASSDDYERTSMSIFVTKDVIPEDAGDLDIIKSLTYQCSSEYEHCMKDTSGDIWDHFSQVINKERNRLIQLHKMKLEQKRQEN